MIESIRLKCLELAVEQVSKMSVPMDLSNSTMFVIDKARAFEAYITECEAGSARASVKPSAKERGK